MSSGAAVDPRFELVNELGRGGMGIVYRARDRERGEEVALKALREIGPSALLRLKREFRVMCDVRHPNLVRLGELVERDGGWFFTMELVEGVHFLEWVGAAPDAPEASPEDRTKTLATAAEPAAARAAGKRDGDRVTEAVEPPVRGAPTTEKLPRFPRAKSTPQFNEAKLRTALRGIVEGLGGLHAAGLVHRDIKPSNIKIDPSGRVVLLDFGVTVALDDEDSELAGTYAYMAPEQAERQATAASDWYAVGVMLFRAMTGHLPFPANRDGLALKSRVAAPLPDDYVRDLPRELSELCSGLLMADPAKRAGEADVRAVVGRVLPLRAPTSVSAPFVGRRRERERLAKLRKKAERECQVALIIGLSGVGKTALARRFLDEAEPAFMLLESRCDQRETVPFNALDGIIDGLARLVAHHRDRLPEPALAALQTMDAVELRRLFPVLPELSPGRRSQLSAEDSRAAAARALRDVLFAIGTANSLALLIDDAQWADADSCALLADLLASPAPPMLLVVTARGPERPPLMAGIRVDEEVILEGLDEDDALALAKAVAAHAPVDAAAIAREANGHPMFIAELSRFSSERRTQAAGNLDEALWARASDASAAARRLLHVVVVDGGVLPRSIAVAASGLDPDEAADAIAELRVARLIRAGDQVVEPYHDRVHEALVTRLPPRDRIALHRVLAGALEGSGALPERLAHHWAGAGENEKAAHCAELAAARAADTLAFERAAEWLAMALSLGKHDDAARRALLISRADALTHAGHLREAGLAFLEASRTGEFSDVERNDLRRRAAERLLSGGYMLEGLEVERELLAAVGLPWPESRGAALRSMAWLYMRIATSRLRWRSRAESELSAEQKLRLDTCWSAAVGLSMVDSVRGAVFAMRSMLMSLGAGDPRRIACSLSASAFAAAGMNQHRRLRRLTKAIARAVTETDAPEARCYSALAETAQAYFVDNDWRATQDVARRGLDMWNAAGRGHTWEADLFEQFVGWGLSTAGEHRGTADYAETVLRGARRRGDRFMEVGFRVQFPHQHLLDDHIDDGRRDVDDALASWPVPEGLEQITNHFYWAWRARALFALYSGRALADAATIDDAHRRIQKSLLWQVPAVRLDVTIWAGALSLARASELRGKPEMRAHLAAARRSLKQVAASPLPARTGSVHSFRAVIAHLEGNDKKAIEELRTALGLLEQFHSVGALESARWRLGQLVGGDEGNAMIEQARGWLRTQRARRPERMVAWGMPGIGDR